MTRPSGRERVSEFLDSYYSINPGLPHHHDELGASIARDLDTLTAARKAAERADYLVQWFDDHGKYSERDDLRALRDALPKCESCGARALWRYVESDGEVRLWCDEHGAEVAFEALPYAEQLRALGKVGGT